MKNTSLCSTLLAAGALLASTLVISGSATAADRIRFECDASGAGDISMGAKFERSTTSPRRKFSTEFEAAPQSGFNAGNTLKVIVKGVRVGSMVLAQVVGGDVVGDLNFDTRPDPADDELPFPANWPANVGKGSVVKLKRGTTVVLGCTLN